MSWYRLPDIRRLADEYARDERDRPPAACPYDGTPLEEGDRGQLFCPFDEHYFWPQDGRVI